MNICQNYRNEDKYHEEAAFSASAMDVFLIQADQGAPDTRLKTAFQNRLHSRFKFQQRLTIKHVAGVSSDTISRNRMRK